MLKNIILLLLFTFSLFAKNEEVTLLLSWKNQFQFAGYYMAIEKGFYDEAGLNVNIKEYDLKRDNAKDVSSRKYEFGIKHSPVILDKIGKYPNLKLLAAINQSSPLILISKKYDTIHDIKNKTINITKNDLDNASIHAMLHFNGVNTHDYVSTNTQFNLDRFINDEMDFRTAYVSNEPFTLANMKIPFNIFDPKDYGYDFYSDILFTSEELIKEKPQVVKGFYYASMKGWKYAYAHMDETINVILRHYNTQNRTKDALFFEANTLKKLAYVDNIKFGNINPIKLKEISTTLHLLGLVNTQVRVNYDDFIYHHAKQDSINTELILKQLYQKYKDYIKVLAILFLFIILGMFYLRYKLKSLLKLKILELDKSYKLFDEYTIASRTDISGKINYVTKAFCEASGYTKAELIGQTHRLLKEKNALDKSYYKDMWMSISSGHTWQGEFKNITKDGSRYWTKAVISPLFDEKKNIVGYEGVRQDITVKKILEEYNQQLKEDVKEKTVKLKKYTKYLNTLFDINPNITYVLSGNELTRVNKAFLDFTGFSCLEEFLTQHRCICELFTKEKYQKEDKNSNIHCHINKNVTILKDGIEHLFTLSSQRFIADEEEQQLISLEDITEIQKLAVTDKLTGIYNRVRIDDEIAINHSYYTEHGDTFSIILIDIDFFKRVNDKHGHLIGDEVLKDFAKVIKKNIRETDTLGRWGGEEFLIICPHTNAEGAFLVAQTIRENISKHIFSRGLKMTLSAGISNIDNCKDIDTLLTLTDEALYKAKESGRNRVVSHPC